MRAHSLIQFVALVALLGELVLASKDEFMSSCLDGHNRLRSTHRSEPVEQDNYLVEYARWRADTLAWTDTFKHLNEPRYGENLFMYSGGPTRSCADMIRAWYDEIKDYSYRDAQFSTKAGHFTQVIWRSTTRIGCAQSRSKNTNAVYVSCQYDPPGNVDGEFERNVLPPTQGI